MVAPEVLDEIKQRTDLTALISEHVALKRSGRGFLGLCPFHQEKTPSFHLDPERGFFHCFGCNAGGNAFTFLMRVTGAGFRKVVGDLAQRAGIALKELSPTEQQRLYSERAAAKAQLDGELRSIRDRRFGLYRRLDDVRRRAAADNVAVPERDALEVELAGLDDDERALRAGGRL